LWQDARNCVTKRSAVTIQQLTREDTTPATVFRRFAAGLYNNWYKCWSLHLHRQNYVRLWNQQLAHFPQRWYLLWGLLMFRCVGLWFGLFPHCLQSSHRSLLLGKSCSPATVGYAEAQASKTPDGSGWQNLLGIRPPFVGCLEAVSRARQSWDGRSLASRWLSTYWSLISKAKKQVGGKNCRRKFRSWSSLWWRRTQPGRAPRIHGELLTLGFDVSERTISRWMKQFWVIAEVALEGKTPW